MWCDFPKVASNFGVPRFLADGRFLMPSAFVFGIWDLAKAGKGGGVEKRGVNKEPLLSPLLNKN
jgi:hypothetical protein